MIFGCVFCFFGKGWGQEAFLFISTLLLLFTFKGVSDHLQMLSWSKHSVTALNIENIYLLFVSPLCHPTDLQLSQQCPPDRTLLMGQKTCLLMAAAASLEHCRKSLPSSQVCHTPTPSARLIHFACSPSTWMEMYWEWWRREVTNSITGAGVGVSF